jgi:uncharacterized membrane protein YqgA involved in biofilm formation
LAIVIGGLVGLLLRGRLADRFNVIMMQGLGLTVLVIGLKMALQCQNSIIVLLSLVIGGLIGEALRIEDRFESFSHSLENRMGGAEGEFSRGFVAASLLYCVGAMAVTGAIQNGLTGDYSVLLVKSFLDGISALALSAGLGYGVIFSAIPVLMYQGAISLLAIWVKPILNDAVVLEMSATGGVLILAIALATLQIKRIKIANFLPALLVAAILSLFWRG